MSTYTEFGPDRLRFAGLIPERLIFAPKSKYSIGFQPTIKRCVTGKFAAFCELSENIELL